MPDLLTEVVRASASATGSGHFLDQVARLLAQHADWVIADRLDDPDLITRVAAYDAAGPLTLTHGMGPARSRRSGAGTAGLLPTLLDVPGRLLRLSADDLEAVARGADAHQALQARTALSLDTRDLLMLGLVARDVLVGVLTLGSCTGFSTDQLHRFTDVGLHVSLVLDADRLLAGQRAVTTAMQNSLLRAAPAVPGLLLASRYRPAQQGLEVGGDWYDAFQTDAGLVVVVGDASGHDIVAASRMADLRNLLRAYAVDRDEPPSGWVARLDRRADTLGLDATATCVVGRLRPTDGGAWQLMWSSAGHLPPLVVRASGAELLETPADLMLGVAPALPRTDHEVELRPGDLLVLYSDGLVEVRGISLDDRLETLRQTAGQHAGVHPDALADALLLALTANATDDVAVLAVQILAPG